MEKGERRRYPRLPVRQTEIRNGLLTGRVVNLSLGGLAIESSVGLRVDTRQRFSLRSHQRWLRIATLVRWCRLDHTVRHSEGEVAAVFRIGVAFTETPDLFHRDARRSSGDWLDLALRVPG